MNRAARIVIAAVIGAVVATVTAGVSGWFILAIFVILATPLIVTSVMVGVLQLALFGFVFVAVFRAMSEKLTR